MDKESKIKTRSDYIWEQRIRRAVAIVNSALLTRDLTDEYIWKSMNSILANRIQG